MEGLNIFIAIFIVFLFIVIIKSKTSSESFKSAVIADAKRLSRQDIDDSRKKCYGVDRLTYEKAQIAKNSDTCARYTDSDIYVDKLCQDKLWKQAGCTKPNPINYLNEQSTKKIDLLNKFTSLFRETPDSAEKISCSGRPCDGVLDTDKNLNQDCLNQIWKDSKCTTQVPFSAKEYAELDKKFFNNWFQTYAASGTDEDKLTCYGVPCANAKDTDKNIDQYCYNKIWKDKCTTPTPVMSDYEKGLTLVELKNDTNAWATNDTETHRKGCYNMTREQYNTKFNINPCVKYNDTDKNIEQLCYNHLWKDKCTTPASTMDDYKKSLTLVELKNDTNLWSRNDTPQHRKGCYNMTQAEYNIAKKITDPCISFPNATDTITSQLCYEKLWKDAGCTTNSPYDLNTKW
jgi:hypothetical protein